MQGEIVTVALPQNPDAQASEAPLLSLIQYMLNEYKIMDIEGLLPRTSWTCYDSSVYSENVAPIIDGLFHVIEKVIDPEELKVAIKDIFDRTAGAAIATALAARFLESGSYDMAHSLSAIAMGLNQMDLFAQRINVEVEERMQNKSGELANYLKQSFCSIPFNHFETASRKEVFGCCPAWLPRPLGSLDQQDWQSIWHSEAAEEIRQSILDGAFKYCSPRYCPYVVGRTLEKRADVPEELIAEYQKQPPTSLVFSHDESCNLSCPSCRKQRIVIGKSEQAEFDNLTGTTLIPLMESAKAIKITGSGDPFGSIHFRNLLANYCRDRRGPRKLILHSNGVLFDEAAWTSLKLEENVESIYISVDAATEDTYKIVRRGGDFHRLMKNLEFLSSLRRQERFNRLIFMMVVQKRNYKELPAFIEMSKRFGMNEVALSRIRNWGTFPIDEFLDHDIARSDHPEHAQFLDILKTPVLDDPIVLWGDLIPFAHPRQ